MYGIFTNSSHENQPDVGIPYMDLMGLLQRSLLLFLHLKFGKSGLWYKRSQQRTVPMSHPMICKWLIAMVSFRPLKDRVVGPPFQMAELHGLLSWG